MRQVGVETRKVNPKKEQANAKRAKIISRKKEKYETP